MTLFEVREGMAGSQRANRRRLLLLACIPVAGALGYSFIPEPVDADLAQVTRGQLLVSVAEGGRTRIRQRYVVVAPLAGRLARVELRPGDLVKGGETVLAVIEPTDPALLDPRARAQAEFRVKTAEVELEAASAQATRAHEAHELSKHAFARASELIKSMAVPQDELDTAEHRQRMAEEDARCADLLVETAAFELGQVRAALLRAFPSDAAGQSAWRFDVLSPIDGKVLRVFQESATVVAPATRLMEIGNPEDLEVEIALLTTEAVKVRPGDKVLFEDWGGGGALRGRVRLIEPAAFTRVTPAGTEEQRVWVIAEIEEPLAPRAGLGDGYHIGARIIIEERRDALKIPVGALLRRNGASSVLVASRGRAHLRRVEVGLENGAEAEILAGLEIGDTVVLHPGDRIRDGARIRPARPE